MVHVYVYPKELVKRGQKSPRYVSMKSIYKDEPSAVVSMIGLQWEQGFITLNGAERVGGKSEWGTQCGWCEKKYNFDNMLIIVDKDECQSSVMCPKCYKENIEQKRQLKTNC